MPESLARKQARARKIIRALKRAYPDAKIALDFETPLELLVATILAAQCTDERVNLVTPALFKKYRSARDWATADLASLEREVHSTGFYRAKAKAIVGMARALVERHGGEVPRTREALTALPGVGLKTANVVLGNARPRSSRSTGARATGRRPTRRASSARSIRRASTGRRRRRSSAWRGRSWSVTAARCRARARS